MKRIVVPSKFSGGEEVEEKFVLTNALQVISCGRRVSLPSILEENCFDHASYPSVDVGAPSRSSVFPPVVVVLNPTPLRCYRPPTADFNGVDDIPTGDDQNNLKFVDEVDTTLRLSNYSDVKKRTSNPTPPDLGWFRPGFFDGVEDDDVDTTLSLRPPSTTDPKKSRMQVKGKRRAVADDAQKRKRSKREDNEPLDPPLPIEQILTTLMQAIQSRNGSRPIFLYRKILEDSDVKRGQNRLFVTRRMRMMDYLREEEAASVDGGGRGLKIVGVDAGGNVYDKLGLTRWASVNVTVINSDWWRVVGANSAQKGDVVEIWGFRVDEKPCLAFNFRRGNAGPSGTSGSDEGTSPA